MFYVFANGNARADPGCPECVQRLLVGTNRMLLTLIREKTKRMTFMAPLGDLDTRNMVRIASCAVKPEVSGAALTPVQGPECRPWGPLLWPGIVPTQWVRLPYIPDSCTHQPGGLNFIVSLQNSSNKPIPASHINLGALYPLLTTNLPPTSPTGVHFTLTCNPIWPGIACSVLLPPH